MSTRSLALITGNLEVSKHGCNDNSLDPFLQCTQIACGEFKHLSPNISFVIFHQLSEYKLKEPATMAITNRFLLYKFKRILGSWR